MSKVVTGIVLQLSKLQRTSSGRIACGMLLALIIWIWSSNPPALASEQASLETVQRAYSNLLQAQQTREQASEQANVLQGERGDFEQRGIALQSMAPEQRAPAIEALKADTRLLEQLARTAEAEREQLQAYDNALMARTRDLGAQAEQLRAATWPIVEHLKLYPEPLGTRHDWNPPTANFFETRHISMSGSLSTTIQAAIDVGRSTYDLGQLLQLDATYAQELETYAQTLKQTAQQPTSARSTLQTAGALLISVLILGLGLAIIALLEERGHIDWSILGAIGAIAIWWLIPQEPLAFIGGSILAGLIAYRPKLAAFLPIISIPMYYRPRTWGAWQFPVSETLIGWIGLGYGCAGIWYIYQQRNIPWQELKASLKAILPVLLGGGCLLIAAIISLQSPILVEQRPALRELRRSIAEPMIWASIGAWLIYTRQLQRHQLIWCFTLVTTWIASDALIRASLGQNIWATGSTPRITGLLPSSTAFAVLVGAGSASSLGHICTNNQPYERWAAWLTLLPLSSATLLSFTRGAWLGIFITAISLLLIQHRWRILGLGLGLGILASSILLLVPQLGQRILRLDEQTGSARQLIWSSGWNVVEAAPITGAGLDQFAYLSAQTYAIPQIRFLTISHPHNLWLDIWIQLGLLGVCLIGGGLIYTAKRTWQHRSISSIITAGGIIGYLCIHGIVDQTMFSGDLWYLWWMAGIIIWIKPQGGQHERRILDTTNADHAPT